ncbi:MAG: glycosyltransferase family 2 protein [Bacteroidales bacterium]|jgi:GT2 family glycosyltransferase|nr:glycosyltransferase family 2 protein [Bacteroidales bacterium]
MFKTAIVILNWNGLEYLKQFLGTTVMLSDETYATVFIADNCSTDGSVEWVEANFKQVKTIRLDRNYGFAGGYNLALEQIDATYFLLLNSDIEVTTGWLKPMTEFMDTTPCAASCQPKILSYHNRRRFEHAGAAGGYIDRFGYPFCRGRILHTTETDIGQYDNVAEIFWSSGACMMIRAEAWKRTGGFDPSFFAHMEEIDLCWRLGKLGYRAYCIPQSAVYHVGGGSLPYSSPFKTYLNYRNSLFMLYKNLPGGKLKQIILARKILDGMSALRFLAKFELANFMAVIKAHTSCRRIRKTLIENRSCTSLSEETAMPAIFNKSIIFEYYLKRRITFDSLKWKHEC